MSKFGPYTLTGNGIQRLWTGTPVNSNIEDIVWKVTVLPPNHPKVDANTPAMITRIGYIAFGTTDTSTEINADCIGQFRWIDFEAQDWNLLNNENSLASFIMWRFLLGVTVVVDVWTY